MLGIDFNEWIGRPAGRRFIEKVEEEQNQTVLAERVQWAGEKQLATDEFAKVHAPLVTAERKARENLNQIKTRAAEMIREAERAYHQISTDRQNACTKHERRIAELDRNLISTASPRIDAFKHELEVMRSSFQLSEQTGQASNGQSLLVKTNARNGQMAALRICRIIVDELPRLRLEALTADELTEAIESLRQSIPQVVLERIL